MTTCIFGIGLIGGSFGMALQKSHPNMLLLGVERNPEHAQKALERHLVHEIVQEAEALQRADLIILATPVDHLQQALPQLLDQIGTHQTIMDTGSTKQPTVDAIHGHPRRNRFVATHPMAGTEYSGPDAAIGNLFEGKVCVLCDTENSASDAVQLVKDLYTVLNMQLTELPAAAHDLHAAYVSHISHIASFALALTVLAKEEEEDRIFELASAGFGSTVRLAKSNPDTWVPIFRQNRDHVLDVLDEYINTISRFRTLLIKRDFEQFGSLIRQANGIKRIIDQKKP